MMPVGWMLLCALLVAVLFAAAVSGVVETLRTRRAARTRRLAALSHQAMCDASDAVGLSVLCGHDTPTEQLERLLAVEYLRYEVIQVLDARAEADRYAALAARYALFETEYRPTREFPIRGVRALARSRSRNYRRFVLLDRAAARPGLSGLFWGGRRQQRREAAARLRADWNAAASVAAYEYLLPLEGRCEVLPGSVERLIALLGAERGAAPQRIRARLGGDWLLRPLMGVERAAGVCPLTLYAREAVAEAGGFARVERYPFARAQCRTLREPLARRPLSVREVRAAGPSWRLRLGVALLVGGMAVGAAAGWWAAVAACAALLAVWRAAVCIEAEGRRMVGEACGTEAAERSRSAR